MEIQSPGFHLSLALRWPVAVKSALQRRNNLNIVSLTAQASFRRSQANSQRIAFASSAMAVAGASRGADVQRKHLLQPQTIDSVWLIMSRQLAFTLVRTTMTKTQACERARHQTSYRYCDWEESRGLGAPLPRRPPQGTLQEFMGGSALPMARDFKRVAISRSH